MKDIPDKLYINKYMIRPGMLHPAEFPPDNPEWEYIRKDALLEWAKEQKKYFGQRSDELEITDPTNPDIFFFDGKRDAFTAIIAKLNSL